MNVSVVIPTRNRLTSLRRTLNALAAQSMPPSEIIVVDSSDEPITADDLDSSIDVKLLRSAPSVCRQRNAGVAAATGTHILLCDDDVELPPEYISVLARLAIDGDATAISGIVKQQDVGGEWVGFYPIRSLRRLLFTYLFRRGTWGPVDKLDDGNDGALLHRVLVRRFARIGNSVTRAGWPVITQVDGTLFSTRIYALGASLIERQFLLDHPFDTTLDPHGIGDNYGVCLNLPRGVVVTGKTHALHHKDETNRLDSDLVQYRRALALDYFRYLHPNTSSRAALCWSILGPLAAGILRRGRPRRGMWKSFAKIASGRNPYILAIENGQTDVEPEL